MDENNNKNPGLADLEDKFDRQYGKEVSKNWNAAAFQAGKRTAKTYIKNTNQHMNVV
jgi:hypothetical protein